MIMPFKSCIILAMQIQCCILIPLLIWTFPVLYVCKSERESSPRVLYHLLFSPPPFFFYKLEQQCHNLEKHYTFLFL